jgi:hypothetical protein
VTRSPGLLRISREMAASDPVFIVGEARSGTSILYRTFMKHSSFRPREPNLVETEIFAHLRRVFMFGPEYPGSLRRYMLDDEKAWGDFLASIRPLRVVSALNVPVNLVARGPMTWTLRTNLAHLVLRTYFFHARRARGCRRLLEKTPTNTPHVPALVRTFPRARLLYIHRHPVDVFSSYRRRGQDDPDAAWARALTPRAFCDGYERNASLALDRSSRHGDLLPVPYEKFTGSPKTELQRVCAFLDEPFEASMVDEPDPDPGRWRGDPLLWGPIVPVTKRWADYMTEDEADRIQDRLQQTMRRLGYERVAPPPPSS